MPTEFLRAQKNAGFTEAAARRQIRDKGDATLGFYFTPTFVTFATTRSRFYHDTLSLEAAIRAKALLYELLTAASEEIIRQHG